MKKNVPGHFVERMSSWRKLAGGTWGSANDPTIYGTLDLDVHEALAYVDELRVESGEHVTITHLVSAAISRTLARHPECNGYVRLGRVFERETVDTFVLVAVPPSEKGHEQQADLSGVKIRNADTLSIPEIARITRSGAQKVRAGRDPAFGTIKRLFKYLPPPAIKLGLKLVEFLQYDLNLDLSRFAVPRDSFGCALVTSVGMFGIQHAFPPLIPMTRLTCLVAVGEVVERPVAEGGRVVIRPMLPITATFDHRVVDGYQAAKLSGTFTDILQNPRRTFG